MDDVNRALGLSMDTDNVQAVSEAAINLIRQLQAKQPHMDRMLYLVAPTHDQCEEDEDGTVSRDLLVWATDASEAVKLWRDYYELDEEYDPDLGILDRVRVFECPIMPAGAPSAAVGWGDIHTFGATIAEREQLP
jgi:hypothetical protein